MSIHTDNTIYYWGILPLIILLVVYIYSAIFLYQRTSIVQISSGKLQGFVSLSRNGREYSQFLGIPYAKPPVGSLRFESPQPPLDWTNTLNAVSYGAECMGFDFIITGRVQGEESCLFLNVMTPEIISQGSSNNKKPLMPVLVFIHGGAFQSGSSSMFPGKYFMDHDIVLVTINYRLGIFGFLITADGKVKGNMGLKDQVMALKWIQTNIKEFGGDPNQVTIMGSSAGAGSVHLLMLSKMSQGLFHRAISNSNDALSEMWQLGRNHTEHNEHVAAKFDCPSKPTTEFVECLRSIDASKLVNYHKGLSSPYFYNNPAWMVPAIEMQGPDAFLSTHPLVLLKEGRITNKVPWLAGVNKFEGFINLGHIYHSVNYNELVNDDHTWNDIIPQLLVYNRTLQPDVAFEVKKEFLKHLDGTEEHKITETLSTLITEEIYVKPIITSTMLMSSYSPVYLYLYNYKSSVSVYNLIRWVSFTSFLPAEIQVAYHLVNDFVLKFLSSWTPYSHHSYGPSHGDEMLMLFNVRESEPLINLFDAQMSKIMVETIADFTNVRKPVTFQNLAWPAVNPSKPIPVMELKEGEPEVLLDPFKERLKFWKELNITRTWNIEPSA